MQFQRQAIRIGKEGHLLSGEAVDADRLAEDALVFQLFHRLFDMFRMESQMPQSAGFRIG